MLYPIKVIDIELSEPINTIEGLEGYMGLQGLVRVYGTPLGYVNIPVISGMVSAKTLKAELIGKFSKAIIKRHLKNWLASPVKASPSRLEDIFDKQPPATDEAQQPLVTVVVCTRNRTADLSLCLESFGKIDYPFLDLLVVDNAPSDESTKLLVQHDFAHVRYVEEPRPGLDWARNRAILEAKGSIIAYTDDDVMVDPGWITSIVRLFLEKAEIMAVTGLVVPYELETRAQVLFEMYGGFGRGFERRYNQYKNGKIPWGTLGTGQFGTGANMAFRRNVFASIGSFDPALDVGTVTNGGGDLEMFFRILKEGHMLVYEPAAVVRHRHRREYAKLKEQLANNSKGLLAYCMRSIKHYPDQRFAFIRLWLWWVQKWNFERLKESYMYATAFPRELILAEFKGCFKGRDLYKKAYKNSIVISKKFGAVDVYVDKMLQTSSQPAAGLNIERKPGIGIATIELSEPLQQLNELTMYGKVRYYLSWNRLPIGTIDISNDYKPLCRARFVEMVVDKLDDKLIIPAFKIADNFLQAALITTLQNRYHTKNEVMISPKLPNDISVSVVVATYDRPQDLHECLVHLVGQVSDRSIELIVVDNHPASGLTGAVVAKFPGVILVNENRAGLSYARNKGISASTGQIILSTDDDVIVPPDWVERLVAPFTRADVMIVTGNVLPVELELHSQQLFEEYGGLGRGYEAKELTGSWFQDHKRGAVPTWKLGACANAAFRASIFSHPQIGMISEKLGAGTPTGCSEDTYLFYKVLKAGYTMLYEPDSQVRHNHRKTVEAFRKQLYNYSKGHVAYHLETWLADDDWRGFSRILVEIPMSLARRLYKSLIGRNSFPAKMILNEITGTLAGPWALYKSGRRVKKLGKSDLYIPPGNEKKIVEGEMELMTSK